MQPSTTEVPNQSGYIEGSFYTAQKATVRWRFFGDNIMVIEGPMRVSKWKRFWCWFFFGSTFEDLK